MLPNLDYLLKKGTTIPCVLKTGIDTTLAGFVICEVLGDVYSANGKVLLIERGATVFGEQRTGLKQGQARTFVVWTRIDNPSGVFANIDSPATDQMGYNGIPGYVDTHFWARFGGAIMLSLIKDFSAAYSQRLAQSGNGMTGQVPYQNTQQATENMAAEALRNSINIPPTLVVLPATVVNVLVARDVSFENVFSLVE
jgi:type IV secretion system protein VirB10